MACRQRAAHGRGGGGGGPPRYGGIAAREPGQPDLEWALARLTRAYGIDPDRWLSLPAYLTAILIRQLDAIEAQEDLRAIRAASYPYLKPEVQRGLIHQLQRLAGSRTPPAPIPVIEENPAKAAAWFEAQGIRTERGEE